MDLVIHFEEKAIIVIEVKKGDADDADTIKHDGYYRWLADQPCAVKHSVLIALSAEEETYAGFTFWSWESLCIEMRTLAIDLCKDGRVMVEAQLGDYASALQIDLPSDKVKKYSWPSFEEWKGDGWELGVKLSREKPIPGIRWWETYCCLEFSDEDQRLICCVGEWFPNNTLSTEVHKKLRRANSNVLLKSNIVWLEQRVEADKVDTFDDDLDRLLQQWIKVWKNTGGIKDMFM